MGKIFKVLFILGAMYIGIHSFSAVEAIEIDNRTEEVLSKTTSFDLDKRSTILLAEHNEKISDKVKNTNTPDFKNWRFNFGVAYSEPSLKEADELVDMARQQLSMYVSNPPEFEKWDDIIKGSFWISIAKRLDQYKIPIWPEITVAYGKGGIETTGYGLQTPNPFVPGQFVDLDFLYKTDYKFLNFTFGAMAEFYRRDRLFFKAGIFGTYGILKSDLESSLNIPQLATNRIVQGDFKDDDFGLAGVIEVGYDLKWPKNAVISIHGRGDIRQKFKGPINIVERTTSPPLLGGDKTDRYTIHNISDITGWTANLSIGFYF